MNETCKRMLGSMSDYIDGDLDAELCSVLENHLRDCQNCQVVIDTMRKTIELFHVSEEKSELPENVRKRLFVRLNLSDFIKNK